MRDLLAVAVGGVIGTGLRLGLDTAIPHSGGDFPLSTFLINVVGAFALGLLVARVWSTAPGWLKAGLGTGVLGSFTTFSALAVSVTTITDAGAAPVALTYLVASLAAGLVAAFVGLRLGRSRVARRIDEGAE